MPHAPSESHTQTMQCMEVWGGNQIVDNGVVMPGLDAWIYSKPFGESAGGGDVHYVSSCATGRITRLLVADVSGHGAAVQDVAGQLRALMRRYVNYVDPTRFVAEMNQQFTELSEAGCFATALVTTFFGPTQTLTVCNAGHPPALLYRAASRRWSFLEFQPPAGEVAAANIPLGIEQLTKYSEFDVDLRVGDMVICYTDSLIEAHAADGELLGMPGLLEIVKRLDPAPPETFTARLLGAIAAVAPGNLIDDDVTVLLFRPNGRGARAPFFQRALAPIRLGGAVVSSLYRRGERIPWPEFSMTNLLGFRPRRSRQYITPD